jgi:hypothetical protein
VRLWFLRDTPRLGSEKAAIEALAVSEGWFLLAGWGFHEGNLAVRGEIAAHGYQYPVRLIFPDQFPEVPCWVEPQDDVKWSNHQYGSGGSLCLELRPDNWVPSASGADMLRSAFNLLLKENPLGKKEEQGTVTSAHNVTSVQSYDWGTEPVLIGGGCLQRLVDGQAQEVRALRWMSRDGVWPILVHDRADRATPRRPPGPDVDSWRFEIPLFINRNAAPAVVTDRKSLLIVEGFESQPVAEIMDSGAALIIFAGGAIPSAFHLHPEAGPFRRKLFIVPAEEIRSGRTGDIEKSVAIVGLGSVGSKIAESLLRSGVWKQLLADGDIFLPGNLDRHSLDWRDVGYRKVHGVRRRLLDIVPGAEVTAIASDLSWQRSARVHAADIDKIAAANVIIDATGDAASALLLGAVAHANGKPFVSVEVFEGGIGALVASCLPKRDPAFADARAAFLGWCDEQTATPPKGGTGRYGALDADGKPIVADDAAVTTAAGHAARVVLDILDGQPADGNSAWLLLGFRKSWVFNGHGHTIRLSVGTPAQGERPVDEEARAFIRDLLSKEIENAG